jgi:C-terminal processing protease CtpA/Prc
MTKKYVPEEPFEFSGDIYILADNDSFSASEDFVRAARQLKIAKIAGAQTAGSAASVIAPWLFELPNSHILFVMQVETSFNPDGTINDMFGTMPDLELEPSTYPTSYPTGFTKKELLEDQWIERVLKRT